MNTDRTSRASSGKPSSQELIAITEGLRKYQVITAISY
jgi:hypothetical protein